jgi:hypothetical protein
VVSVGLADGVDCAVGATLRRLSPTMSMPGALLWDNPSATLQLDSTGDQTDLLISGIDKDLAGNPTGGIAPGIAVNGNHLPLKNSIPSPRYDADIVGLGGNKSVSQAGASTMDYQSLIDFARTNYDIRLNKQGYPNVNLPQPWGTPDNPMVVYAKGDSFGDHVDLDKRKVIGAGILVVDGSLEVGDAEAVLDWKGIVIIRSKLLIDDAFVRIVGGVVMYGPYQHSQIDDGNITIQYSTEALARALQVLGPTGYVVLNWRQAPVPPAARAALEGGY